MNILLLSTDDQVIKSVKEYAHHNSHQFTTVSELNQAKKEIESNNYDSVLMDCSIRPSELINFSSEIEYALTNTVVLLIGPVDHSQRELLSLHITQQTNHYAAKLLLI